MYTELLDGELVEQWEELDADCVINGVFCFHFLQAREWNFRRT